MLDTDAMGVVSGGLAETLKPTESLIVLLRPVRWDRSLAESLVAGEYRVRVRYHGPAEGVLEKLRKTWPEKPLGGVWTGDVSSAEATFQIADEPEGKRPELVWGEPVKGLRAAVEFRSRDNTAQSRLDDSRGEFPHGSRLSVYLHVRNVSEQAISFWSETWRQDDAVMLVDENGDETRLGHPWYSGWANIERWTLQPGQTAVFRAIALGIAADEEAANKLDKPIGSVIVGKPGEYRLRYELRFNAWQTKDNDGRVIPGDGDWQGTLSTGITTIAVRSGGLRMNRQRSRLACDSSAGRKAGRSRTCPGAVAVKRPFAARDRTHERTGGSPELPVRGFDGLCPGPWFRGDAVL